ncbi:hypothetical protein FGG08_002407 [Glutinoglossum americanum]|uniref:mitogen-activated protein kinase kinase n=1 Tax=Glutinoglossum americanum TaxID=1670608 RepID=A0A9P8L1P7_9PEZI|nr:hypothetical protein FGG08_002407 [Glutinoglossum americanum]
MTSSSDSEPLAAPDCPSSPHLPSSLPEDRPTPGIAVANLAHRIPSLRSVSEPQNSTIMSTSSTPLGALNAARRPVPAQQPSSSIRTGGLPQDMQAKMKAFHLSRQGAPPPKSPRHASESDLPHPISTSNIQASSGQSAAGVSDILASPNPMTPVGPLVGGATNLRLPPNARPQAHNWTSSPAAPGLKINPKQSIGARRGLRLPGGLPGSSPSASPIGGPNSQDKSCLDKTVNEDSGNTHGASSRAEPESLFTKFSNFVDTKNGTLKFAGKAVIHGKGIDFSGGSSFNISLDEVENLDELGKGNYGTVYKVRHSRPPVRRPGMGLAGNRQPPPLLGPSGPTASTLDRDATGEENQMVGPKDNTTSIIMAMKEIRLELDEAKFAAIIMELDILHRCLSPFIIDFYGAFFQEGAVYICMEYMDGGSIDKLYGDGIPEAVLRKITLSTVMGLKTLKEEHNIIHRDVKPTNILANSRGQVKICDFGVSGNLVASIAKTNIGCQSYMAPERITSGGIAQAGANPVGGTYSAQSDIWSLGLSIIECAMGRYPYPPETYNNIFSQLSAIVDGDPPDLPQGEFSAAARDFVRGCLNKIPKLRPTYAMLLRHAWLSELMKPPAILETDEDGESEGLNSGETSSPDGTADKEVAEWVIAAIERRKNGLMGKKEKPALHAAPLDSMSSPSLEKVPSSI